MSREGVVRSRGDFGVLVGGFGVVGLYLRVRF